MSDLNKQLSIEMLEARRAEKNFQSRRNESYAKTHAELVGVINRDFDKLLEMVKAGGLGNLADKTRSPMKDSGAMRPTSRRWLPPRSNLA